MSIIKVKTNGITADAVTDALIADDVVGTEHLTAGEVDATALGADSVTAAKINDDIISGTTALTSEPDDTDEFLVSDGGTLKRIDYSLIKGGGITEADQYRLTTDFTTADGYFASNLERNDTAFDKIGTGISESSGVFSFPSTGIYLVEMNIVARLSGNQGDIRYAGGQIDITTDGSGYTTRAEGYNGCNQHSSAYYFSTNIKTIVDVTNTSNVKVKFNAQASNSNVIFGGNTDKNECCFTFIRLGDT